MGCGLMCVASPPPSPCICLSDLVKKQQTPFAYSSSVRTIVLGCCAIQGSKHRTGTLEVWVLTHLSVLMQLRGLSQTTGKQNNQKEVTSVLQVEGIYLCGMAPRSSEHYTCKMSCLGRIYAVGTGAVQIALG